MKKKNTLKIGAACDLGVHVDGAHLGPIKLLSKEDLILIQDDIEKSRDKDDLKKNFEPLKGFCERLYNEIAKYHDAFVMMIGGDHSLSISSALASTLKNPNIGLIWIDAHTDYHTLASTESGNLHGLPCALINHYGDDSLTSFHMGEYIQTKNTVIFGARSVDDGEWKNLEDQNVTVITMDEIYKNGLKASFEKAYRIAMDGVSALHISYDLDFLDPSIAPGVSTPVLNGASQEIFEELLKELVRIKENIQSFDLVEFNPLNDKALKTYKIAKRIIESLED